MVEALQRAIAHPEPVTGVRQRSPLAGLDRRSVGFVDVLSQSVSAVAPSAAATTIPIMVAAAAGSATVWAIGAAMLLALLVGVTVNVFTRRMASTGSLYTFVARGLGTGPGSLAGASMAMGYGFIAVFALAGGGYYMTILIGHFWPAAAGSWLVACIVVVAMGAVCFIVLARGIRLSTRLTLLIESVSLVIIVLLVVALIAVHGGGIEWSALSLTAATPTELAAGAALGLTAFVGFESAATLGVEARRPFASIPRAIIWTVIVSGVIFVLSAYSQLIGFAALGRELAGSASPVNELTSAFGIGWMGLLLDASIAFSFVACALASTTALTRLLFSMGRDALLPAAFGRAGRRFRTPIFAIMVAVPIVSIITLLLTAGMGSAWAVMQFSIVCAATGYTVSYIAVCVAAPVFLARIGELTVWPVVRAISAAVVLTVVLAVYLAWESDSARSLGVWVSLALVGVSVAAAAVVGRRRPNRWSSMGSYDEPVQTDLLTPSTPQGAGSP